MFLFSQDLKPQNLLLTVDGPDAVLKVCALALGRGIDRERCGWMPFELGLTLMSAIPFFSLVFRSLILVLLVRSSHRTT
jgi:hypothetical protein